MHIAKQTRLRQVYTAIELHVHAEGYERQNQRLQNFDIFLRQQQKSFWAPVHRDLPINVDGNLRTFKEGTIAAWSPKDITLKTSKSLFCFFV